MLETCVFKNLYLRWGDGEIEWQLTRYTEGALMCWFIPQMPVVAKLG